MTLTSIQVSLDSNVQRVEDPVEEPNTEKDLKCVNGTLELKGTYQVHSNYVYKKKNKLHLLSGCHRVIAQDATLELFAPLVFNSTSLDFQGNLTVVGKAPMEGSCLRVLGQVVISGDFFVKDCQNQRTDSRSKYGGGINALNVTQKSGRISIENCSSKSYGGAIYVKDSFTQEGGEMMLKHCQAGSLGGGVYAEENFTQNNGVLQVEDCSAGDSGGGLYADKSFRQTGGNISLSNCRADIDGGGLSARDFEQLGGAMSIQSCEAKEEGGGLRTFGKIFRQDGELHVRACGAQMGGALWLLSSKVKQGKSATALVEARQLEEKCLSQISGPHTQLATHKHTELLCILESYALAASCDGHFNLRRVGDRLSAIINHQDFINLPRPPRLTAGPLPEHAHWKPFWIYNIEFG